MLRRLTESGARRWMQSPSRTTGWSSSRWRLLLGPVQQGSSQRGLSEKPHIPEIYTNIYIYMYIYICIYVSP